MWYLESHNICNYLVLNFLLEVSFFTNESHVGTPFTPITVTHSIMTLHDKVYQDDLFFTFVI